MVFLVNTKPVEDGVMNWSLAPGVAILLICSIVGFIGNGIMIICFIREKKFHSACHFLVALKCLLDTVQLSGQYVYVYHYFTRTSSTQEQCFWMLLPTQIALFSSGMWILVLGIDRLIACVSMKLYNIFTENLKVLLYLVFLMILPATNTSWLTYQSYTERDSNTRVKCSVTYAMGKNVSWKFGESGILIMGLVVAIYSITFIRMQKFYGFKMRALFNSISYTVVFTLSGWLLLIIFEFAGSFLIASRPSLTPLISTYAEIGINIALACNIFVFFATNKEYRGAIRRTLVMPIETSNKKSSVNSSELWARKTSAVVPN